MTLHTEFFDIHPKDHSWVNIYHLMNSIVQPRPIAWISSVSDTGTFNLAPFSYFNICSMNPSGYLQLHFLQPRWFGKRHVKKYQSNGQIRRRDGLLPCPLKKQIALPPPSTPSVSEFDEANVQPILRGNGEPPFISDSPVQLVCELNQTILLGEGAGVGTLVLGNVKQIYLSTQLKDIEWQKGVSPERMGNVGRMGADFYAKTSDLFRMPRATVNK